MFFPVHRNVSFAKRKKKILHEKKKQEMGAEEGKDYRIKIKTKTTPIWLDHLQQSPS